MSASRFSTILKVLNSSISFKEDEIEYYFDSKYNLTSKIQESYELGGDIEIESFARCLGDITVTRRSNIKRYCSLMDSVSNELYQTLSNNEEKYDEKIIEVFMCYVNKYYMFVFSNTAPQKHQSVIEKAYKLYCLIFNSPPRKKQFLKVLKEDEPKTVNKIANSEEKGLGVYFYVLFRTNKNIFYEEYKTYLKTFISKYEIDNNKLHFYNMIVYFSFKYTNKDIVLSFFSQQKNLIKSFIITQEIGTAFIKLVSKTLKEKMMTSSLPLLEKFVKIIDHDYKKTQNTCVDFTVYDLVEISSLLENDDTFLNCGSLVLYDDNIERTSTTLSGLKKEKYFDNPSMRIYLLKNSVINGDIFKYPKIFCFSLVNCTIIDLYYYYKNHTKKEITDNSLKRKYYKNPLFLNSDNIAENLEFIKDLILFCHENFGEYITSKVFGSESVNIVEEEKANLKKARAEFLDILKLFYNTTYKFKNQLKKLRFQALFEVLMDDALKKLELNKITDLIDIELAFIIRNVAISNRNFVDCFDKQNIKKMVNVIKATGFIMKKYPDNEICIRYEKTSFLKTFQLFLKLDLFY